ncbi:MAG: AAA family ATPase [Armatimonadetes bacterium]|nr:AAA family ATPase [Armatimonadota bacterium]
MITKVHIENFRSLRDVTVELGPLTVLVGKNGSGKSNFLDALTLLHDAVRHGLDSAWQQRGFGPHLFHRAGQHMEAPLRLVIEGRAGSMAWQYELALDRDLRLGAHPDYRVAREVLRDQSSNAGVVVFEVVDGELRCSPGGVNPSTSDRSVLLPLLAGFEVCRHALDDLTAIGLYELGAVRAAWLSHGALAGALMPEAQNLTDVLAGILGEAAAAAQFETALGRLLGYELHVRARRNGDLAILETRRGATQNDLLWLPASCESTGAHSALALLAALYQPSAPTMLAIEEPETHLHPEALPVLAALLEEAAESRQVVVTTQSPDLLHLLQDPRCIRVVEWAGEATRIGPLDEVQLGIINDEVFGTGDLLRIEGLRRRSDDDEDEAA